MMSLQRKVNYKRLNRYGRCLAVEDCLKSWNYLPNITFLPSAVYEIFSFNQSGTKLERGYFSYCSKVVGRWTLKVAPIDSSFPYVYCRVSLFFTSDEPFLRYMQKNRLSAASEMAKMRVVYWLKSHWQRSLKGTGTRSTVVLERRRSSDQPRADRPGPGQYKRGETGIVGSEESEKLRRRSSSVERQLGERSDILPEGGRTTESESDAVLGRESQGKHEVGAK